MDEHRYQRRSGKCQLIFLLLLLIFGCVIIILCRPSHPSAPSPTPPPPPSRADSTSSILPLDDRHLRGRRFRVGLAGAGAVEKSDEGEGSPSESKEGRRLARRFLAPGRGPSLPMKVEAEEVEVENGRRRRTRGSWTAEDGELDRRRM